jgi:hypothetical protein
MPRFFHTDPTYRAALHEMSVNLNRLLNERNWSRADLTRAAAKHMPEGARFGADNTSNFVNGKRGPTRPFRIAMCTALGVEEEDIFPPPLLDRAALAAPMRQIISAVPGKRGIYHIFIDREFSWENARKIVDTVEAIYGLEPSNAAVGTIDDLDRQTQTRARERA